MSLRHSWLLVVILVVLGNLAGWWALNQPVDPKPWGQMINGVSFSPYQSNENPQENRHPTAAEIDKDLALLVGKVKYVRSYSATDGLNDIAPLAKRHGLLVTAGAWIDGRRDRNEREIANVIEMARNNKNVVRVLVGNETLLRTDVPIEDLIGYIRRVRSSVTVPVSSAEPWHVWLKNPELAREVDFIAIHILPYWEKIPADQALNYVMERYQQVKDAFPTKPVVITEVGWPSDGRLRGSSSPTPTAQATFLREFLNVANQRGLDYYIMEAFDQPWKRDIEGSVGAYWGIYNADRAPKFPMVGTVHDMPNWKQLALASSILALAPLIWFLARWSGMHFAGRVFYGALIQGVITTLVYVGYVGMSQYMTAGTAVMWSMLVPMLIVLLILLLAEALEMSEVMWSKQKRHFAPHVSADPNRTWPKVSIHVPLYNEPPDMVKQTLDALDRLDYPNVEFVIVDNNTKSEAVWRPVEEYCAKLGPRFRFFHVSPLAGFKAGALNFALRNTAPDAEIVGVIDSDYVVTTDWLKSLVPYFDRAEVGFVQAPQDHRDWRGDAFKEMINWEYAGFFHIGMVQRNEHDAIIQHGTMTLIRKQALDKVGNWAEWCICEDAEMGLRLMIGDWESVYLNRRFGYGLTPDSFTGYKSQRFRWAYGAMQILKKYWRDLLPGKDRKLSPMQRYHFISGWMPWVADSVGLIFAVASIFWSLGVLLLPRYFEFPLTLFLVPTLGVFVAKILQFLWLYKVRVDCTLRQRLGAGLAGLALTYTIAKATLYGLFTSKLPFIRTPKLENQPALMQAFSMAKEETILFILLWMSGIAVWNVYGNDDPEARLWSLVMFVQSGPFVASLMLALVNSLAPLRRLSLGGGAKPVVAAGE